MNVVKPGKINGVLRAPGSKSMMQRVVALACLASGETEIENPSLCDDGLASIEVAKALGCFVNVTENCVRVMPGSAPLSKTAPCGESGTSLRIFSAVASSFSQEITLTASGTLIRRPMDMVEEPLSSLGAHCTTDNGHAPVTIRGPLLGGAVIIDGSITSQFLSGLLIALPLAQLDSFITAKNLKSTPYVLMTMDAVRRFGGMIQDDLAQGVFKISGQQRYAGCIFNIEGDWSGASFPLVAGALCGKITVHNLNPHSLQADKKILEALELSGASLSHEENSVTVVNSSLKAFEFDATDCPDLFPPLIALASGCSGVSSIKGLHRLAHKESDRGMALRSEFGKMGISITQDGDTLVITGGAPKRAIVSSHHDHRIAMACAVASLRSDGPTEIQGSECVSKSYPNFFTDLELIRSAS